MACDQAPTALAALRHNATDILDSSFGVGHMRMVRPASARANGPCVDARRGITPLNEGRVKMTGQYTRFLLAGCAAWTMLPSSYAHAQSATTSRSRAPHVATGGAIEEVVVTANKRSQNIQKVGLSITAISGSALAERHVVSLQDIAAVVPGLSFTSSTANTPHLHFARRRFQ